MKAIIHFSNISVEVEGVDVCALQSAVASVQEVFGENVCGLCGGAAVHKCRNVKGNDYPEMLCTACGARLSFGKRRVTNQLFPIRQLTAAGKPCRKTGSYGDHRGWTKYRGDAALDMTDDVDDKEPEAAAPEATGDLPRDGKEFMARMALKDKALADAGRCKRGELIKAVQHEGKLRGCPMDLWAWSAEQIQFAAGVAIKFVRERPVRV